MHPVLFRLPEWLPLLGGFAIHTYGFLIALGIVVGTSIANRLGERDGLPRDVFNDLVFWAVVGGVIGGRLEYARVNPEHFQGHWLRLLNLREGGLVFYGTFVGGIGALWIASRLRGLSFLKVMDTIAPALPLIHAFGRLGCFSAGCCYGRPADVPWAVTFPDGVGSIAPAGVPLHPTQLYAATYLLFLSGFLFWLRRHRRFTGQLFLTYTAIYPVFRSINELFRGDKERGFVFESLLGQTLSNAQFISLLVATASVVGLVVLSRRSRQALQARPATA